MRDMVASVKAAQRRFEEHGVPELTEEFAYILSKFGAPKGVSPAPPAQLGAYSGHLPKALLDVWALHGQGLMLDGKFQFCNPARLESNSKTIFGNDPQVPASRCHIIGYSAFGTLLVWSEDHADIRVDLLDGTASSLSLTGRSQKLAPDVAVSLPLFQLGDEVFDAFDEEGKPLFARALEKLGPLAPGEMYGFVPMLALGGRRKLENLEIVSALEHMAILAQARQIKLIDTSTMAMRVVRVLG